MLQASSNLFFLLGLLAAGVMGFAIQRGATCTVAAVDEVVQRRSAKRLVAMLEAALWVSAGLFVAQRLQLLATLPSGYELTPWTLAGAALLGLGAYVNRACVFGAIARLGSGEWAYAATPLGYFLGCLSAQWLFDAPPAIGKGSDSFMLVAASGAIWLLVPLMFLRFYHLFWRTKTSSVRGLNDAVWSPHGATIIIGFSFLATLLLVGTWAYTDVLAELARGMSNNLPARLGLAMALLGGAIWGGYTAGRLKHTPIRVANVVRCLGGGVLMAWGSLLIPGGNDGLILIGMPLLWVYAWAAFMTMCVTVAVAQTVGRKLRWD